METGPDIGVIVVSQHTLLREGVKAFFGKSRYKIRNEAATIAKAVEIADDQCDLLFIGSRLDREILEPLKSLRAAYPRCRIVFYAQRVQLPASLLVEIFGTGLDGCLMSDSSTEVLHQSLDLIMMGEHVFPFHLLLHAIPAGADPSDRALPNGQTFSEREVQVLNYLREGRSNKFIARELQLSEATVKVHIKTLLRKIGCTNRTQAAIWVTKHGTVWACGGQSDDDEGEAQAPVASGVLARDFSAK